MPDVTDPNKTADENEGHNVDIEPIGVELLEIGEVVEWNKAVEAEKNDKSSKK